MEFLILILIIAVYFLPSIFAMENKNNMQVLIVNILFGWTFIGWGIAFVMAFKKD